MPKTQVTDPEPSGSARITGPFSAVSEPGAFVNVADGTLFRIPPDALAQGRSPLISITSRSEVIVARISNDPWIGVSKARQLAADFDLPVNF